MKISVCTVTARRGFVEHQAKMLASQTHKDLEWVLVDFAFEERAKFLKDLGNDLGLSIIHVPNVRDAQLHFRDITRNRNRALQRATGAAVIFLDDYAVIPAHYAESHHKVLERLEISAGIMHRLERPTDTSVMEAVTNNHNLLTCFPDNIGRDHRDQGHVYQTRGNTYTGNLGIPRCIFEELNGFDPRMASGLEDCDFGERAALKNFVITVSNDPYTINLNTGHAPYVYHYDHAHDVEPFISNPNNNYAGDVTLTENDFMRVEFHEGYRVAVCKICGARGMIDPNELMAHKRIHQQYVTPIGLPGGYR
jgi:hypothetical protein